jgi:hypothetical protein
VAHRNWASDSLCGEKTNGLGDELRITFDCWVAIMNGERPLYASPGCRVVDDAAKSGVERCA